MNQKTIDYYDSHAEEFFSGTIDADMSECRARFLAYLPRGKKILDAGCGSGRDILAFLEAGYEVEAFDASAELCRIASQKTGVAVRKQRFEDLPGEEAYDGIWACASLLHGDRQDLPDVLRRLDLMRNPGGVLYASFKHGTGEREKGGRYFNDLTEEALAELLSNAGFEVKELFITADVRSGRGDEKWVNAIAERQ